MTRLGEDTSPSLHHVKAPSSSVHRDASTANHTTVRPAAGVPQMHPRASAVLSPVGAIGHAPAQFAVGESLGSMRRPLAALEKVDKKASVASALGEVRPPASHVASVVQSVGPLVPSTGTVSLGHGLEARIRLVVTAGISALARR